MEGSLQTQRKLAISLRLQPHPQPLPEGEGSTFRFAFSFCLCSENIHIWHIINVLCEFSPFFNGAFGKYQLATKYSIGHIDADGKFAEGGFVINKSNSFSGSKKSPEVTRNAAPLSFGEASVWVEISKRICR
jgi:hypothetical protein